LKNDEAGNKEKAFEIRNVLDDLYKGEKSKDITKKYFDTKNTDIGVKKVINENGQRGNASLERNKNGNDTIYFDENKASDFYSAMSKIDDGVNLNKEININEKETLSVSYYGHEQEHHGQKHLEAIDKALPLDIKLLDIVAEIKGRERAIGFLEDVHKGKNNIPDFRKTINDKGAYNISINNLNRFFNNYEIKEGKEIINEFARITHKDYFYPKNAIDIFLKIINKDRKERIYPVDLKRYLD